MMNGFTKSPTTISSTQHMSSPTIMDLTEQSPTNKRPLETSTIMDLASPVRSPQKRRKVSKKKRRIMEHLMNFRTNRGVAELRTMPDGSKRVVNSQKAGSPYGMTWLMPMARLKYPRLNVGGDEGEKKKYLEGKTPEGRVTREQAKLSTVVVHGGLVEDVHNEQRDFVNTMLDIFDELLPLMWQNTSHRSKYESRAKKLMKNKTPEEQAKKAFTLFKNDVRLPFRRGDENIQFNVDNSAYRRDGSAVEPTFFNRDNEVIEDLEKILDGAVARLAVSLNIYETPAGMVGIKFRWDSRNNVLLKNGSGRMGPTEAEMQWNQQASFVERDGNVYANSATGGRYMVRTPDMESLYQLASNEGRTMNNITVEAKDAKYGATMVETPETKEFFDHMLKQCENAIKYMFDSKKLLKEATQSYMEEAKAAIDEGGQEQTQEELAFELFMDDAKIPIQQKDKNDPMNPVRIMKFTQRTTYPSGDDITFTFVDAEGNTADADGNPYTIDDLARGDKTSQVIALSPWISPSGDAYGVSFKIEPTPPIHIAEKSTASATSTDLSGGYNLGFLDSI